MTIILGLLVAVSGGASATEEMNIPVDYRVAAPADVRIPISASVRAVTWDELTAQPDKPAHIRLACIVFVPSGAPGNCVPASLVPPGQKIVAWDKIMDAGQAASHAANAADIALFDVAARRVKAIRLLPGDGEALFSVRFFDEIIAPADARPPFSVSSEQDLTTRDVVFATPLDGNLLAALYPSIAMRYSVNAQVRVTCKIEADLQLLCRDPGAIAASPNTIPGYTAQLMEALRFSTYQLASTIRLAPKSADGRDVAGRNLRFVVRWSMP